MSFSSTKQAILLTMSVLGVYLYLQVPFLREVAVQFFAFLMALYLLLMRWHSKRLSVWQSGQGFEIVLLNAALLLLVGYSGSLYSPFYVVTFVHLFVLSMVSDYKTTLIIAVQMIAFHFSLSIAVSPDLSLSMMALSNLLALPLVTVFYLFTKWQYKKAYYHQLLARSEMRELLKARSDDRAVDEFVDSLLNRRLPMLEFLLSFPDKNKRSIEAEMKVLKSDLNLLLGQMGRRRQQAPPSEARLVPGGAPPHTITQADLSNLLEETEREALEDV